MAAGRLTSATDFTGQDSDHTEAPTPREQVASTWQDFPQATWQGSLITCTAPVLDARGSLSDIGIDPPIECLVSLSSQYDKGS